MLAKTVSAVRSWAARRKALLAAVIRVVTKPALAYASGNQDVADTYGELLGASLVEALDLTVGNAARPAPKSDPEAEAFLRRLDEMGQTSSALLDKLEKMPDCATLPSDLAAVEDHVRGLLRKNTALQAELSGISRTLREQALSLPRIEAKLEEVCHVVLQMRDVALEDFKQLLINSPLFSDWEEYRRADPEAVHLLNEADRHFLAGRRAEGMECLRRLFELRGVGKATLAHHLGLHQMGNGDLPAARATMLAIGGADLPAHLKQTMIAASTFGRQGNVAVWRSLPRGFPIADKYRIETEIGRGGMASVYRAVGIDDFNEGQEFAIKVPAPGLLCNKELIDRFGREITIARKLSDGSPSQIVLTVDYVRFTDPFVGNANGQTQPVNTKKPNPWGLFHMAGNVWEWCLDCKEAYPAGEVTDPTNSPNEDKDSRVLRGGSWDIDATSCRAAYRSSDAPGDRSLFIGFRPCFRLD